MSSYTYIHASQRTPGAWPGLSHRGLCHAMQGTETHTLGHQGNGLVCWTSQVKQPDILSWGPSPPLPVAIYLILKYFRFAHPCCVFPAWFLSRAGKAGSNKERHPMGISLVLLSSRCCPRKMFTPNYTSDHSCSIFTFPFPSPLFVGCFELMPNISRIRKFLQQNTKGSTPQKA